MLNLRSGEIIYNTNYSSINRSISNSAAYPCRRTCGNEHNLAYTGADIIDCYQFLCIEGNFILKEFLVLTMLLLIMASVASSLTLPFVFKYGVEKGRAAYYVMIGVVCAGSIIATTIFKEGLQNEIQLNAVLPIACLVGIGIYVLSWYLSVVFYKKKEM